MSDYMQVEELRLIQVFRKVEKGDGYQRILRERDVALIQADLIARKKIGKQSNYPAIRVALRDGIMECVDGQHRLEAHKRAGMACKVDVIDADDILDVFIRDNSNFTRINKQHLLSVSSSPRAEVVTAIADKFDMSLLQVMSAFSGVAGDNKKNRDIGAPYAAQSINAVREICQIWSADRRFSSGKTGWENDLQKSFSTGAILFCLGRIAKDHLEDVDSLRQAVKLLQSTNWVRFRGLRDAGHRGKLFQYIQTKILLPAYQSQAKEKSVELA